MTGLIIEVVRKPGLFELRLITRKLRKASGCHELGGSG